MAASARTHVVLFRLESTVSNGMRVQLAGRLVCRCAEVDWYGTLQPDMSFLECHHHPKIHIGLPDHRRITLCVWHRGGHSGLFQARSRSSGSHLARVGRTGVCRRSNSTHCMGREYGAESVRWILAVVRHSCGYHSADSRFRGFGGRYVHEIREEIFLALSSGS